MEIGVKKWTKNLNKHGKSGQWVTKQQLANQHGWSKYLGSECIKPDVACPQSRIDAELYKSLLQADDCYCLGMGEDSRFDPHQPHPRRGGGKARVDRGVRSELGNW